MKDDNLTETPQEKTAPAKAPPSKESTDLSRQIEQAVERGKAEHVRCIRVFGDFYRCNWWSRLDGSRKGLDFDWAGLITDHISKSRFLTATLQDGKLVIAEVGPGKPLPNLHVQAKVLV